MARRAISQILKFLRLKFDGDFIKGKEKQKCKKLTKKMKEESDGEGDKEIVRRRGWKNWGWEVGKEIWKG